MIKKVVNCKDYDGNDYQQTCWFDLSQAELFEIELEENGFSDKLKRVAQTQEPAALIKTFKLLLTRAYGVRPVDNPRLFVKNDKVREEFFQSPAYTALLMDLLSSPETVQAFFEGVVNTIQKPNSAIPAPADK